MKYIKPALLYPDQLALMVSRGVICTDNARALEWLKRIGYYRLSAYFIPFRVPGTDNFQPGTTLDQIIDLYKFDCNLRLLVMQAMDRIEIAVRAVATYHLAHDMGEFGYADPRNFRAGYNHGELMRTIAIEEGRSAELFVAHYRRKYTSETYLPIWMATELISFGALFQDAAQRGQHPAAKENRLGVRPAGGFVQQLDSRSIDGAKHLRASQQALEQGTSRQAAVFETMAHGGNQQSSLLRCRLGDPNHAGKGVSKFALERAAESTFQRASLGRCSAHAFSA
jgi:hypothetical protein